MISIFRTRFQWMPDFQWISKKDWEIWILGICIKRQPTTFTRWRDIR